VKERNPSRFAKAAAVSLVIGVVGVVEFRDLPHVTTADPAFIHRLWQGVPGGGPDQPEPIRPGVSVAGTATVASPPPGGFKFE
jgi:hypothetical protein